ncbi:MAG: type II secretion system F family protein [Actinomycetota bacterium]
MVPLLASLLGALAVACFALAAPAGRGRHLVMGSVLLPGHRPPLLLREILGRVGASRVGSWVRGRGTSPDHPASGWSAEELSGAQIAAGAIALVGCVLAGAPVVVGAMFVFLAAAAPRLHDRRARRARAVRIDREVPQLLDLLAAAASAGLAAPLALRRATDGLRGPLAAEFGDAFANVSLGGRWRHELSALIERLGSPDLRRMVAVVARTERLGIPLADAVAGLASEVRRARRDTAMERARKAPVKMLLPLVFMILPAFLLLTVVPVLVSTVRSIR